MFICFSEPFDPFTFLHNNNHYYDDENANKKSVANKIKITSGGARTRAPVQTL